VHGEDGRGRLPLAHLLLTAGRSLDALAREELGARGWPRLSGAQSLVFAYLDPGGTSPAELARRLGTTRQAAQDLVAGLVRLDLLEVAADPARRAGRLVRLTASGRALAADAGAVLAGLEAGLGERATDLRRLLTGLLDDPAVR
jgi:DNA-binding MarR family transcriptional regulator